MRKLFAILLLFALVFAAPVEAANRVKTFVDGEVILAADINAEYDNTWADVTHTVAGTWTFSKAGTPITITPGSAPAANTVLFDINNTSGTNLFSVDNEGDALIGGTATITGNVTLTTLTATRVPFASTAGLLVDDADLTFATDTLSATKVLAATSLSSPSLISTAAVTVTPAAGSNLNVALSTTGDLVVNTTHLVVDTSAASVGFGIAAPTGKVHILSSATTLVGLIIDTPVSVTATAQDWYYNGTISARLFARAGDSIFVLNGRDLGNDVAGPNVDIGRNTSAGAVGQAAGHIRMVQANATAGYLWIDNAAKFRIHTAAPTGSSGAPTVSDTAGRVFFDSGTNAANLIFTDNTYDIGASGATRPRDLFLAGDATVGGNDLTIGAAGQHAYVNSFANIHLILDSDNDASSLGLFISHNGVSAASTPLFAFRDTGVAKIGGTTTVRATTEGTNHLDIFDGTAPVGTLADGISLYSTAGELRVMDAAGNATLLSPHGDNNEWIFYSKNTVTGQVLRVRMERLVAEVERLAGKKLAERWTEPVQ